MNVVVLDAGRLAGEADFPMLDLPKFGWQQYPESVEAEVAELCWRSDIIVSVSTPIDKAVIDKAFKLKLIVAAGDSTAHIDSAAAAERGIKVCNVPGADPGNGGDSTRICNSVVESINAYLKELNA